MSAECAKCFGETPRSGTLCPTCRGILGVASHFAGVPTLPLLHTLTAIHCRIDRERLTLDDSSRFGIVRVMVQGATMRELDAVQLVAQEFAPIAACIQTMRPGT